MAETTAKNGYRATIKYFIASPTKVRPVANVIKRKSYTDAMAILEHIRLNLLLRML